MTGTTTGRPTDAWALLLPPGWVRFPTSDEFLRELDEAIEEVVARALPADLPRDSAEPHRRMLADGLRTSLADARAAGAGAVYLPTEPMNGVIIPASLTELELISDPGANPLEVMSDVVSDDYEESELVEVDGRPGVRVVETTIDAHPEGDLPEVSTRQVVYVVSRSEADGEWLVLSFSIVWNSEETQRLAEALVFFFDAVMTTFRWAGPGANPVHLPERSEPDTA
ncbi:hypothetical protein [Promicromonospora aerolata]|uniref:ESAT-6 protein secretion system EspG family protein n=1 Tax=Promicromonospora aerolata TaxID=195749 RepID=A0ABW4VI01_9MICO